jgi:hypothetical protein
MKGVRMSAGLSSRQLNPTALQQVRETRSQNVSMKKANYNFTVGRVS